MPDDRRPGAAIGARGDIFDVSVIDGSIRSIPLLACRRTPPHFITYSVRERARCGGLAGGGQQGMESELANQLGEMAHGVDGIEQFKKKKPALALTGLMVWFGLVWF